MKSSILFGLALVAAPVFLAEQAALANPLGGVVAAGTATITQSGATLTINQTSSRAIIDWGSFNIGPGQSTSFHFLGAAGANSAVLNEVTGSASQSFIDGLLNSYVGSGNHIGGTVFIYNPNGLLIGRQGSVNVGSLIGTSLSPGDSSFMKGGNLTLGGASATGGGSIQNQGQISALDGDIFLIAHNVENDGALTANNVSLAAGSYVEIKQPGLPGADRISVLAGDPSNPGGAGADNSSTGLIKAVTTRLQAAGGNVYALAVNNSGVIHADTIVNQGGAIYLLGNGGVVQNSGTLDASDTAAGGKGGQVVVTGSQVTLTGTSAINANGDAGGGAVLIGGGSKGKNPAVADATDTTVEAGATITADAITKGNGGQVVVWSDDTTTFAGQISARGGANGGNGGSAEVSAAQTLDITGHADLTAPHGTVGNLLLDPGSVDIVHGANTSSEYANGTTGDITDGWVNNQLTTSSVTITTSDAGANVNNPTGILTVDAGAAISWSTGSSLSLTGANGVAVYGTITGTGTGGLTLSSPRGTIVNYPNSSISVGGPIAMTAATGISFYAPVACAGTGGMTLNSSIGSIDIYTGGSISAGGAVSITGADGIYVAGPIDCTGTGSLTLTSSSGSVGSYPGGSISAAGPISMTGGAGINIGAPIIATGTGGVTLLSPGGNITIANDGPISSGGAVSLTAATGISVYDTLTLTGTAPLTMNADSGNNGAGDLGIYAAIDTSAANAPVNITAADISLFAGSIKSGSGLVSITASDNGSIGLGGDNGALTLNNSELANIATSGGLTFNTTGGAGVSIGGAAAPNVTGPVTINAPGGTVAFDTAASSFTSLNVASAGGVTLSQNVTTTGDQSYTPLVTLGASVTLSSGTLELNGGVSGGANTLTLNNSGAATAGGTVAAGALILEGAGNVGAAGSAISTDVGGIAFQDNSGGVWFDNGANPVNLSGTTVTANGNVYLTAGATSFGETTVGGNLSVTAGGAVSQTGAVAVAGNTVVSAGANPITLNNSGNDFSGAVTVDNTGPNAVALNNGNNALTINGSVGGNLDTTTTGTATTTFGVTSAGSLTVISGGAVNQTGPVTVSQTTSLTAGAENNISLGNAGNSFAGAVTINSGDNVTLVDSVSLLLNGTVSGNLNATANGIDINGALTVNGPQGAALNADPNNTGMDNLTVGAALNTTAANGPVNISAANIILTAGSINSGSGVISITASDNGAIGLGAAAGDLTLSGPALARITTSGGLTLTTTGGADVSVNGVTAANSQNITGPLTINAPGGTVSFVTAASFFNSLVVNADPIDLNASVTTAQSAGQTYNGAVTLTAPVTLTAHGGGGVSFDSTVDGGFSLDVEASGAATFGGAVGGLAPLASLTVDGSAAGTSIALNGGAVNTSGGQTYSTPATATPLTLGASTALTGTTLSFGGTVAGGGNNLTLDNSGAATLNGDLSGVNTLTANNLGGSLAIDAASVTTTADQNYQEPVSLGAPTVTLNSSGAIELAAVTGNGDNLKLDNTGTATLNGAVTGTGILTADGGGRLLVNNTISTASLYDTEATTFNTTATLGNGSTVATTGDQDYLGTVTLDQSATLHSGSTLELAGVTGANNSLTLDNTGAATLSGPVSGIAALTIAGGGTGTLTVNSGVSIGAASVSDNETTTLNGAAITATGDQNYTGAVILGAGTTVLTSGTIELAGVTGPGNLTLANSGAATLNGVFNTTGALTADAGAGATFVVNNNITAASVSDAQATTLNGAGGSATETVTTTGSQSYSGALVLGTGTILDSATTLSLAAVTGNSQNLTLNNGGTATLNGPINGVGTLDANGGAAVNLQVNGAISAANVIDNETTDLNGGIVTTAGGDQNYSAPVTLSAGTTLNSGTIELSDGVAGGDNSLTLNNTGTATLSGGVSGVAAFSAIGGGGLMVDSQISAVSVSDAEATTFNGAGSPATETVTTTGAQSYTGAIILEAPTTLASGTTLALAAVTGNNENLTLDNGGTATLNGPINGVGALNAGGGAAVHLQVNNTISAANVADNETTDLNGGIVTTTGGDQNYSAPVTLSAGTTLNSGTIELAGVTGGNNSLTLNNTGAATLGGPVSGIAALTVAGGGTGTLTVNSGVSIGAASVADNETTTLNGAVITATGDQNYTGAVILGAGTTVLNSGTIELAGVTGAGNLTLDNSGLATLNGVFDTTGALTAKAGLSAALVVNNNITAASVSDAQATILNGAGGSESVATSGSQIYTGAIILGSPTTLASTGGNITLDATVNGAVALSVEAYGLAAFGGAVGGNQPLASLLVDAPVIDLNGGPITTIGAQTFDGAVTLTAGATLTSLQGGDITFDSSVDGNDALNVETAGTATFDGAVGANLPLASLTVDADDSAGVIALNGGLVKTFGAQNYDTANTVTLGRNTTLTAGTTLSLGVEAHGGYPFVLNANGHSLTLINGGPSAVNGTIIDVSAFDASTTGPLAQGNLTLEGDITTTAAGSITLLEDTTFARPITLTFDTLTLGQKSPAVKAEIFGPGPIIFDNTGVANLAYGSLESVQSILFENPQLAFLPGVPQISLEIPITELLAAEGTAIRSAFDLAKKTIVKREPIEMEVDMRSPSVAGSLLLRSGQLYRGENLSPTP